MNLKEYEVEKFEKLPDIAGASYDAIEEFKPNSYLKLENAIRAFLDYSNPEEVEKSPPVSARLLVAPWGLGKTTAYEVIIKNLLKEEQYNGYSIKIRAQDISNYYATFKDSKEFEIIPGNADRFLFLLCKLLLENAKFQNDFPDIKKNESGKELIELVLKAIKKKYQFFLFFVDELEEVVKSKNDVIPFILKSIKDLLNGSSNIINKEVNPELLHFLSFLLACTDAAMYEISRHEQLEYQYGGIKRRIQEEKILDVTLRESIEYLNKLNKYCYNGENVNSFINLGASFNTISKMAMKNPGYTKSYFTDLMNKSASISTGDLMLQIGADFLLEQSRSFSLEYMETERKAISPEIYNNWFQKFKNKKIIKNLLKLFIGEIKPFKLEELSERFTNDIKNNKILTNLNSINQYISSIHSNVQDAIIPVYLFNNEKTRADIQNILNKLGFPIEETEDFVYSIKFREEGYVPLEEFLELISYFEVDQNGNVNENFFFSLDKEILKQIFPNFSNATLTILRNEFRKEIDTENEYYIINPTLYNIIFPVPIPQDYNLLQDKNENIRIWTDISRRKKSIIYKEKICKIISYFLSSKEIISDYSVNGIRSIKRKAGEIKFFEDIYDPNRFFLMQNYKIQSLSNNPINVMFWREIGNYNENIMNEIALRIGEFQNKEQQNIHIIFLLSQSKIPENLISDLSNNLEFSIVKEIPLSQFDITKYAFLFDISKKYDKNQYNEEKYDLALERLINPFIEIIESCNDNIEKKGLSIKLNNYPSKLSNLPQLLKYIIFDIDNDFSNYNEVELKKPFEDVNPIGLSPRYSSSIDDWSQEKLRSGISDFLLMNGFVQIKESSLKVSMPDVEKNILKIIRHFHQLDVKLDIEKLSFFLFDTSVHQDLLKKIFLKDLENRGLIKIEDENLRIMEVSNEILKDNLQQINPLIKNLQIDDKNFYHIFTFKQRDYSLIYLKEFINTLQKLLEIEKPKSFHKYFSETRKILFLRIYEVFKGILNCNFLSLDKKVSNIEEILTNKKKEKLSLDYINNKLSEYGLYIKLENFDKIKQLEDEFNSIIKYVKEPVDLDEMDNYAKNYYKTHKTDVNLAREPFSYLRLRDNKLEENMQEPFLNLIYFRLTKKSEQYFKKEIFEKIRKIKDLISKISENYRQINSLTSMVNLDNSSKLAKKIFQKINSLSEFEFIKPNKDLKSTDQVFEFLKKLNKELNEVIVPISRILKKRGGKSLIMRIKDSEIYINSVKKRFQNHIEYLKAKKNIKEDLKGKFELFFVKTDFDEYINMIENSESLPILEENAGEIYTDLKIEEDNLNGTKIDFFGFLYKKFKNFKNIKSLKLLFNSLGMEGYADICDKYNNQLKKIYEENRNFDFRTAIDNLIRLQERIEKGYEKSLEKKLSETTQNFYINLYESFNEKGWFNSEDLNKIVEEMELNQNQKKELLKELRNSNLIEKRFHFK